MAADNYQTETIDPRRVVPGTVIAITPARIIEDLDHAELVFDAVASGGFRVNWQDFAAACSILAKEVKKLVAAQEKLAPDGK